jgi:hypothetical protein
VNSIVPPLPARMKNAYTGKQKLIDSIAYGLIWDIFDNVVFLPESQYGGPVWSAKYIVYWLSK